MKKLMKNLTMAAILLAAAMASESALAQVEVVTNDLYLGFENEAGGGTANYIVNLGQASTIVGGTTVVNLNSDVSLTDFDSAGLNGTNSADIMCGVVGGNASSGGTLAHFYVTQTRSGGAGVPSVAGSTAPPPESVSEVSADYTALSQMQDLPSAGNGLLDSTLEWQNDVEPAETPSTVYGSVGVNPDSSVTTSATTYEDLWAATNKYFFTTNFVYQGYFTINFTGATASLTFTPWAAPVPLGQPTLVSVSWTNGVMTLVSGNADPTHSYQLQYTASLLPAPVTWVNVGSAVTAISTLVTNADATAPSTGRFYRVKAQ